MDITQTTLPGSTYYQLNTTSIFPRLQYVHSFITQFHWRCSILGCVLFGGTFIESDLSVHAEPLVMYLQ